MDPLAPSITLTDKEGKGRINYLGNCRPSFLFKPTPGIWFTNQSEEVLSVLVAAYEEEPYPKPEAIDALAKKIGATFNQIETFYKNMHIKYQSGFL